jgi:acetylornithine deacetylase/succinyl-diaminopimelate desuccinylase-like protein
MKDADPKAASNLDAVFGHIEANRESYVARVMEYVRHPSISAQNIGIAEVGAMLIEMLGKLGLDAEAIPTRRHPMIMGRWSGKPGTPTVILYGHYDVQPPEPLDLWLSPPFEPTIREGRIYARGIGDNKGQHFAQLLAIEAHLAVTGTLPCNLIVLLEGEEEIGSPHIAEFVREHADKLKADLVVTADGPLHASGLPVVTFGVRGVAPNAAWSLVHLLGTMRNAVGEITIDGLHDKVILPTKAEREAASRLPLDLDGTMRELGLKRLDAPEDRPFYDRLMFHPTLTINGLVSGYGGAGHKTVLPCEAVAKCDIRLVEAMTPEDVFACVAAHVARHAPEIEFVPQGGMLPSKTSFESRFAPAVIAAARTGNDAEPLLFPALGGSLPDYVFTKLLKLPAFGTPYANHDEANHAPNENLSLDCFHKGIRTGAALLSELGKMRV